MKAEQEQGYDLLILKPFTSKSSKKYALKTGMRTVRHLLAGYFGMKFHEDPRIATMVDIGTEEEENKIEERLFIRSNQYDKDSLEKIIRFDELREYADENNAHLVLFSDIKRMDETTSVHHDILKPGQKEVTLWAEVEMHFVLYDAWEDEILLNETYSAKQMLGKDTWSDCYEEYQRNTYNTAVTDIFTREMNWELFYKNIDGFINSRLGMPFRIVYGTMILKIAPIVYERLGLRALEADGKKKDMLIMSAQTGNDDVRVFSYSERMKNFDGNLPIAHLFDVLPNYNHDGVFVAAGNFDGEGSDEIALSAGYCLDDHLSDATQIKRSKFQSAYVGVYSYSNMKFDTENPVAVLTDIFSENITGAYVAAGDFDGDGDDELAVSQCLWYDRVKIFDYEDGEFNTSEPFADISNVFSSDPTYKTGAYVTAGDFDGDGADELVLSKITGNDYIVVFSFRDGEPVRIVDQQDIFPGNYPYPIVPAAGDFDGDGTDELAVASTALNDTIWVLKYADGRFDTANVFAQIVDDYINYFSGTFPAAGDFDGDGADELVQASMMYNDDVRAYKFQDGKFTLDPKFGWLHDNYLNYDYGVYITTGSF